MAEENFEFFLKNPEAYESLTVEQVHALGRGETVEYGDTAPEQPDAPVAEDVAAAESDETPSVAPVEDSEPVVLAKDGVHTIPFSELEAARIRAEQAEALAQTQAELIESLKAAKTADAGTGDTEAQDDVMAEFKSQYPELAEMLAPALQKMIDSRASELEKRFADALTPIQKTAQDNLIDSHFAAIAVAVPDFDSLVESGAVDKWIETLPSYARAGATNVMTNGTAPEIIELFNQYKATLGTATIAPASKTAEEIRAAADKAIEKARNPKLTSLSDVPAGSVDSIPEEPTTTEGWSRKFAGMSPEAILKML